MMGVESTMKSVGSELAAVLPQGNGAWFMQPHLRSLNYFLFSMIILSSANGYDGSLMNGIQALPQWNRFMNQPSGSWLGFINAAQSLGSICSLPVIAWSANKFGRKKTLFVGYFWLFLGAGLQTGARSPTMFLLGRLSVGAVTTFFSMPAALLITETSYPTHRGIATSLYNTGWYIGSTVAAWATFASRDYVGDQANWAWRIPSILQLLIPLCALPGLLMAPESPRWLTAVGRPDEARAILTRYHAGGDADSPLVTFEMSEISSAIESERLNRNSTSWLDLVRTKGNRHRFLISVTIGIFSQWNGVGIVSYYLAPTLAAVGINSVTQQTLISGFLQIWNLIFAVLAAFTVDRLGRRPLFLISCFGMLTCYIVISGLSGSFDKTGAANVGVAVVPFIFIYYAFYDAAFTPLLYGYTCEIWPYELRARGIASMNISTQTALFFNIFVNPIALEAIAWKYYLVYVGLLVIITSTIYLFYPETNGHSLEEMVHVFDGEDAVPAHSVFGFAGDEKTGAVLQVENA